MKLNNEEYNIKIWNGEDLGKLVAIDTETSIVPFTQTPDISTLQAYGGGKDAFYIRISDISKFFLYHDDCSFIMHNAPFDMGVLETHIGREKVYDLYDRNKIKDTGILYRLLHLASIGFIPPRYNLKLVAEKFTGIILEKDERRENFSQFIGKDIEEIPQDYLEYGASDAIATYKAWLSLLVHVSKHDKMGTLLSHDIQVKGDMALNRIYKRGIGFDLATKDEWLKEKDEDLSTLSERLASWGWVRGHKGIKDRYEQIVTHLGIAEKLPRSEKSGDISAKREDLEAYSHLPFISDYLDFIETEKATSFVRNVHSSRLHPRYNTILKTGRTSCSGPNIQQVPRVGGLREMFIPKEGHVFIDVDYSAVELATLAQVLLDKYGESVMADRINAGECLHYYYASVMHKCDVSKVTKQQRQEAKAANFGFPGGLGIETFIQFSRGYGLDLTTAQAQEMKDVWFSAFPEVRDYMKNEQGSVYTLTGRKRGNTTFCAEKNTPFQGLASDGLKLALYGLEKKGYNVVAEVHDQAVIEVKREDADREMINIQKIMEDAMRSVVPDVKIGTEGMILERWCK